MDITVKKYEHRHLAMSVCEHKCNVGERYVLPQAQAFGLSWSMATAGLADIHNNSCWGRTVMRKDSWDHTDVQQLSPAELQRGVELPLLSARTLLPPLW